MGQDRINGVDLFSVSGDSNDHYELQTHVGTEADPVELLNIAPLLSCSQICFALERRTRPMLSLLPLLETFQESGLHDHRDVTVMYF